jgi:hypothetical protein
MFEHWFNDVRMIPGTTSSRFRAEMVDPWSWDIEIALAVKAVGWDVIVDWIFALCFD